MQSKFSLISGKYLFHDEKLVCTVTDNRYARPLLARLEDIEVSEGTEAAITILCYVCQNSLSEQMRLPTVADHAAASSNVTGPQTKLGRKHTCLKCSQKFFDLNGKVTCCPACRTPINVTI